MPLHGHSQWRQLQFPDKILTALTHAKRCYAYQKPGIDACRGRQMETGFQYRQADE
ncbi:MAG: hypothetical protein ACXV8U_22420 [Methylobacter sp.]